MLHAILAARAEEQEQTVPAAAGAGASGLNDKKRPFGVGKTVLKPKNRHFGPK